MGSWAGDYSDVGRASRRQEGACGQAPGNGADTGSPSFARDAGLRRGEARPTTSLPTKQVGLSVTDEVWD